MDTEKGPEPIDTQAKQASSQWQLSLMPQDLMKALVLGSRLSALAILEIVVLGSWVLVEESRSWIKGMVPVTALILLGLILALVCVSLLCFYTRREVSKSNANADASLTKKGKRISVTREGLKFFLAFLVVGTIAPLFSLLRFFDSVYAMPLFILASAVVIAMSFLALRVFYSGVVKTKRIGYITLAAWMVAGNLAYLLGNVIVLLLGPYAWLGDFLKNLA
ncbi:MAG: hypothetical protein LBU07_03345 [Coriobacteriales bacterium]|jgi:hypothetical protein|nr:hypothetical protein [Coriobacteriales bacterium]